MIGGNWAPSKGRITATGIIAVLAAGVVFLYWAAKAWEPAASQFCSACKNWDFLFNDTAGLRIRYSGGGGESIRFPSNAQGTISRKPIGGSDDGLHIVVMELNDGEQTIKVLDLPHGKVGISSAVSQRIQGAIYCVSSKTVFAWGAAGENSKASPQRHLTVITASGRIATELWPETHPSGAAISGFGCGADGSFALKVNQQTWVIGDAKEIRWRKSVDESQQANYSGWAWLNAASARLGPELIREAKKDSWCYVNAQAGIAIEKRSARPGFFSFLPRDSARVLTLQSDSFWFNNVSMLSNGPGGIVAVRSGLGRRVLMTYASQTW